LSDKTFRDVGLRLPNGLEVWPPSDYKGFSFATPEERAKLLEVLIQTEADLSLPKGTFVSQHSWVVRDWKPAGEFAMNEPSLITAENQDEGAND
jgi:hypothetical protein